MTDELLTPRQVHEEYGFSPQTLANWRWTGIGPDYIKQTPGRGGRIKYKRSRIEAWLDAQTVKVGGQHAA
ncbi:helix-turn-helix transcriptional regulator [Streptomyces sp. NPDC001435]|uniref:helix-turn-helix transcriptional regulator n=1 Tax=Streptomyces sp. NPDC001435 TaxID=3364576 RepID=UPI00369F4691